MTPMFMGWIPDWSVLLAAGVVVFDFGLKVAAFGIIPGNRKPAVGMAWLILILFVPLVGLVAFLFFGRIQVEKNRTAKQREAVEMIREATAEIPAWTDPETGSTYLTTVTRLNRNLGALPAEGGNTSVLFGDYVESIEAMTEAVRSAQKYVHVQFYITSWDDVTGPFFEALLDATTRGVKVRLLFDHLGSRGIPGYEEMTKKLDASDIDWHPMLPVQILKGKWRRPDLRNHRKILVVDGRVAFTGSQNLVEPGYNKPKNHELGRKWVELTTRLEGPVVTALNVVFAIDWYSETDEVLRDELLAREAFAQVVDQSAGVTLQVVPSGPGFVTENNLRLFNTLIYSAERRLSLTSPYFVPDESLLYAVTTAAQRGVAVELFVSEQADQFMVDHAQSSYYNALLDAGVRIWLYPKPLVLHSKHFSVDDRVAVMGSSNMDMRSFALNYEVSVMMIGEEIVHRMRAVEDVYRGLSRELTQDEWSQRTRGKKYLDNVMRLTAGLQ